MKEQLRHLVSAYDRGIVVRIVPQNTPHAALVHAWLFLEFPQTGPVVYADLMQGGVFLHDDDAVAYTPILKGLDRIALAAPASRDLVRKVIKEYP
jgi:hypothetical protein